MTALFVFGGLVFLFALWRFWFFFRNPPRDVPVDPDRVLSPADGFVVYARRVEPADGRPIVAVKGTTVIRLEELMHVDEVVRGRAGTLVGILMTPFDVHYNRAPIRGTIEKIAHAFPSSPRADGANRGMFNALSNLVFDERPYEHDCDYVVTNERATYRIHNPTAAVYVTQIAERWIRRIVTFKDREPVEQGDVFGLIRMGSQVDVFVPDGYGFEPCVRERQHVRAGLSTLFTRVRSDPSNPTPDG